MSNARRRYLERFRRREPLPELSNEPSPDSWEVMRIIDSMPPQWRELVREYGFAVVYAIYEENSFSADDAWMALEARRTNKQQDYATPFFSRKANRV